MAESHSITKIKDNKMYSWPDLRRLKRSEERSEFFGQCKKVERAVLPFLGMVLHKYVSGVCTVHAHPIGSDA